MKKLLCIIIAAVLLVSALPLTAFAAETNDSAVVGTNGDEPVFDYEVSTSGDANTLKAYLEMDLNLKITLSADVSARIGKKGDTGAEYVHYWCTLGKGTKVIDLNGHRIDLYNDRNDRDFGSDDGFDMTMLLIPEGAELVVNDSTVNGGEIHYDSALNESDMFHKELDRRNLIEVGGGKLTVNGGRLAAGRSKKVYHGLSAHYYYLQVNGCAVTLTDGEAVFNGGEISGRGVKPNPYGRGLLNDAAVTATGGKLTVYDGAFWGMNLADCLSIKDKAELAIYGGSFNVKKTDYPVTDHCDQSQSLGYSPIPEMYTIDRELGKIGIPLRESIRDFENTSYSKNGKEMTVLQRQLAEADETSDSILVYPSNVDGDPLMYQTATSGVLYDYNTETKTFEWDKKSKLAFGVEDSLYFPVTRSFDLAGDHLYPENTVTISTSPNSVVGVSNALTNRRFSVNNHLLPDGTFSGEDMFDLSQLGEALDLLEVGQTYYVQIAAHERWLNQNRFDRVMKPRVTIKIKIVDPDSIPDFNVSFNYSNSYDNKTKKSELKLVPDKNLTQLVENGAIQSFNARFNYDGADGSRKTKNFNINELYDCFTENAKHGDNYVQLFAEIYKNGKFITQKAAAVNAMLYPQIIPSVTPDSDGRVLILPSASNKIVRLNTNANNKSGMFWMKDDVMLGYYENQTYYDVDLSNSANEGWYTLGYTVNGKNYKSDQKIYVGIKEGTRNVSISTANTSFNITEDGCSTPQLRVTTTGTGWDTISYYLWTVVSAPEGSMSFGRHRTYSNPTTFADAIGVSGNETVLLQGDYQLQCTAVDSRVKKATSNLLKITVIRPASGITLYTDDTNPDHTPIDVTDSFIVIGDEGTNAKKTIYGVFEPKNAFGNEISYSSNNSTIASVNSGGTITGEKAGSAYIYGKYGNLSSMVQGLVAKTDYTISFPEGWLTAEVGAEVHRGSVTGNGFTAELIWMVRGSWSDYEYTDETFVGHTDYYPLVRIYPDAGVCYPVDPYESSNGISYEVKPNRISFTVNDGTYYGATYCKRDDFYSGKPVSSGDRSKDYIELELDGDFLIDERDDYVQKVYFTLDPPADGDPKDVNPSNTELLDYSIMTDGIINGGDAVSHVTDPDSILDSDPGNDKLEDFETYETGETYRSAVWLIADSEYVNSAGGKVYLSQDPKATVQNPEHKTLTNTEYLDNGILIAYVYFTVAETDELQYLIGDANLDCKINIRDVTAIQRHIAEYNELTGRALLAADTDGDGEINIADATHLQKYLAEFDGIVLGKQPTA